MDEVRVLLEREGYYLYPDSVRPLGVGGRLCVVKKEGRKYIGVVQPDDALALSSPVQMFPNGMGLYELTWENYEVLRSVLPIAPTVCDKAASFGTGDRLGLVSAAHLNVLSRYPIFPVVAQQSPRELMKTNRTFKSVLLDAVMGVLESGYAGTYGADADHIKDEEYLREGAQAGYTMYTLDVSDWLRDVRDFTWDDIRGVADTLSSLSRDIIEECAGMEIKGTDYVISRDELMKSAVIYEGSMQQVERFNEILNEYLDAYDLEVSIDEGSRDTTPEDHLFVAEYLHRSNIDFKSLAPKFPGEFQKGVDYMGDMSSLETSMLTHGALARQIGGYRLSLHSGSDKFSVYPLFAEAMEGNFHVKTSGTSWLQAAKLIASANCNMFSQFYKMCLEYLDESKKAYHVYITHDHFPAELPVDDVLSFFDTREVRQLLHISYGVLLDHKRAELYYTLKEHEEEHYAFVEEHIERHLELLF